MLCSAKTIIFSFVVLLGTTNAYDFLYFAQEWSPAACVDEDCNDPDMKIPNVLGLFPHYLNGTWPTYCNKSATFEAAKIEGLNEMLHERMVAQYRHIPFQDNDALLWEDLWFLHGTCTQLTQADYFFMTLQLALKYDFKDALFGHDIVPSNDRLYKAEQIQSVIQKETGAVPQLECKRGRDLTKVWICLDSSLQSIDCPTAIPQTCDRLISFRLTSTPQHDDFSFKRALDLDHAPSWVSNWLIPMGLTLLVLSNVLIGYKLASQYFQKRKQAPKSEMELEKV